MFLNGLPRNPSKAPTTMRCLILACLIAAHLAIPGRGVLFIESTHSHNWGLYLQLLWSFTKPRRAIGAFLSQSDVGT